MSRREAQSKKIYSNLISSSIRWMRKQEMRQRASERVRMKRDEGRSVMQDEFVCQGLFLLKGISHCTRFLLSPLLLFSFYSFLPATSLDLLAPSLWSAENWNWIWADLQEREREREGERKEDGEKEKRKKVKVQFKKVTKRRSENLIFFNPLTVGWCEEDAIPT